MPTKEIQLIDIQNTLIELLRLHNRCLTELLELKGTVRRIEDQLEEVMEPENTEDLEEDITTTEEDMSEEEEVDCSLMEKEKDLQSEKWYVERKRTHQN